MALVRRKAALNWSTSKARARKARYALEQVRSGAAQAIALASPARNGHVCVYAREGLSHQHRICATCAGLQTTSALEKVF